MYPCCPTCNRPMAAESLNHFKCEPCREIVRFFDVVASRFKPPRPGWAPKATDMA